MKDKTIISLSIFIVFLYYLWTASVASRGFNPQFNMYNYYNMLSHSLLHGKFDLGVVPSKEILECDEREDINRRKGYYLWDTSLYKGKYYTYFGVVPVLTLYIPYQFLTHKFLSDYIAGLFFLIGGLFFMSLSLLLVKEKFFNTLPSWILFSSILLLGLANGGPYLLRHLGEYQTAISGGYFYMTGALYFMLKSTSYNNDLKKYIKYLFLGSLFLGLAAGSRPNLILASIVLIFPIIYFFTISKENLISKIKKIFFLLTPLVGVMLLLMLYNYMRFDNPFEVGSKYHLGLQDVRTFKLFRPDLLKTTSYYYLFHPFTINSTFPFVHIFTYKVNGIPLPTKDFFIEKIVGLFPGNPFFLFVFLGPLFYFINCLFFKKTFLEKFPKMDFLLFCIPFLSIFIFLLCTPMINMRYTMDFTGLGLFSLLIIYYFLDSILVKNLQIINRIFITSLMIISIVFGMAYGIEGCEYEQNFHGLLGQDRKTYYELSNFFSPVSNFIQRLGK